MTVDRLSGWVERMQVEIDELRKEVLEARQMCDHLHAQMQQLASQLRRETELPSEEIARGDEPPLDEVIPPVHEA